MNLIEGRIASEAECRDYLNNLEQAVAETQGLGFPDTDTVLNAADTLSQTLSLEHAAKWLPANHGLAAVMLSEAKRFLSREYLERKLALELGPSPFSYHDIGKGRYTAFRPLGVLTHIAAGNAQGLPAFSVLEGLLTGNINLLKLPGYDDGLSTELLRRLVGIEPKLERYISVFDLPSTDTDAILKLLAVSDGVAVWGSDFAVSGIRALAHPSLQLIEWGHRLSIGCVTKRGETPDTLAALARDICETEQLVCSAPQCVYYESDSFEELTAFGERLAEALEFAATSFPPHRPDLHAQAEITELSLLSSLEELLSKKKVIAGCSFVIIVDENPALAASPGFRTVWLKPMRAGSFDAELRRQHGYLQTAGVACAPDELDCLSERLFRCGTCRVMPCGSMTSNIAGDPHDGQFALRRYVKAVVLSR
jgi:hypothetical protein